MKKIPVYTLQTISCKPTKIGDIEILRFEDHLVNSKSVHFPHRHDFYYLLYIKSGKGTHTVDFKTYSFKPGQLYIMSPGQIHEWDIQSAMKGYTLFFNKNLFYNDAIKIEEQWPYFHSLFYEPVYAIQAKHQEDMEQWLEWLLDEYNRNDKSQPDVIKHLLSALLYKITGYIRIDKHISSNNQLVRKYELLLDHFFTSKHDLSFYADKLSITPNYLNSLCKKEIGKSAKVLFSERVMLEAKRLLKHSTLSVSQVSDHLNFKTASYFIRFFKKHEQITPLEFKNT